MKRPLILVTNDDGVNAPGIRTLIRIMQKLGDVVVVAPDSPRSAQSHAITVAEPLRIRLIEERDGYREYSCNGTPVDCVKLGTKIVLRGNPDLLVSGINHGSNASINVIYSGTMAAVIEATIDKIPAIGFSLNDYSHHAKFQHCEKHIEAIAEGVLGNGLPEGVCLNVNIPKNSDEEIRGIKVCRQAKGSWAEEFDERKDPRGRDYYWITGVFSNPDNKEGTDTRALEMNYIAMVPIKFDLTAHEYLDLIGEFDFVTKVDKNAGLSENLKK
jgi:5'-nucleotidase